MSFGPITYYPIKTKIITPEDSMVDVILRSLKESHLELQDNDILVIAESPLAITQGRMVKLSEVKPSEEAMEIASKFGMSPKLMELILQESCAIYGGNPDYHFALALTKDGYFLANAGIDKSNVPRGYVTLPPEKPFETAKRIREEIYKRTGKKVGILIADSRTQPLRRGNIGLAMGVAGFIPVDDERGKKDLFGRPLRITWKGVAEDIACGAELLMGEAAEQTPVVLVRGANVCFTDDPINPKEMIVPPEFCIYISSLKPSVKPIFTGNCPGENSDKTSENNK